MRLLICTQAVDTNDPALGFFVRWIEGFAKHCESIDIVCLRAGEYILPSTVRVHALGSGNKIVRAIKFYAVLRRLRYDAVFVHMNPEYLVLAGWWWLTRARIVLWYSHKAVNLKLRIAVAFANVVVSTAKNSFNLQTGKLRIVGHGIDTAHFAPAQKEKSSTLRLVSVGRITPIKHLEVAINALAMIRASGVDARLELVGEAMNAADQSYKQRLEHRILEQSLTDYVTFAGSVPYLRMPEVYHRSDLSLNLAPTGGLDKVVLESMACGVPAVVSNRGFSDVLGPLNSRLFFAQDDAADLARVVTELVHSSDVAALSTHVRARVVEHADLNHLVTLLYAMLDQPAL